MGAKKKGPQLIEQPKNFVSCSVGSMHRFRQVHRDPDYASGRDTVMHACTRCGLRVRVTLKPFNRASLVRPWRYFHGENRRKRA